MARDTPAAILQKGTAELGNMRGLHRINSAPGAARLISVVVRTTEIDGIRGWAALSVLLFHVLVEMLGKLVPAFRIGWLSPFLDGYVDVCVFFVLSGDALSASFFQSGKTSGLDRLALHRYFRLTIPISMACLLVWLLMRTGLDHHSEAAVALQRPDWLGTFLHVDPTLGSLIRFSLIGVYVHQVISTSYNPFLWTMPIELVGSMLTFLVCYLWDRLRSPALVVGTLAAYVFMLNSIYDLFLIGVLLGYARKTGTLQQLRENRLWQAMTIAVVLAAGFAVARGYGEYGTRSSLLIAIALVVSFYTNGGLLVFFRSGISRLLGQLSFPIYLVQFPALISLMSWLVIRGTNFYATAAITIAATLLGAQVFLWIEKPLLRYSHNWIRSLLT
ncbi:MAG: acyltransferase family protein [Steroidobacteraceae bacterium]